MVDCCGSDPWSGRYCGDCRFFATVERVTWPTDVCLYSAIEEGWAKVDAISPSDGACEGFEERGAA